MDTNKYFAPIHPGEILLTEFLEPMKISQNKLAIELRVPVRISDIIFMEGDQLLLIQRSDFQNTLECLMSSF